MPDKTDYSFAEDLSIKDATKVKNDILKLFKKKKIVINLSKIIKMDLSIIQILIATVREASAEKKDLIIQGPLDPIFSDFLEDMNLLSYKNGESLLFNQMREGGIYIEC